MATYYGNSSTTSASSYIYITTNVWNSNEDVIMTKDSKKKEKKESKKMESALMQGIINKIGLNSGQAMLFLHDPHMRKDHPISKDVKCLHDLGYYLITKACTNMETIKSSIEYGHGAVALVNVLEYVPDLMRRALMLKHIYGKFDRQSHGAFLISSRTPHDLKAEAEDKKWKADGKGFLIPTAYKAKPVYAEGLEKSDIIDLLNYIGLTKHMTNEKECHVAAVIEPERR